MDKPILILTSKNNGKLNLINNIIFQHDHKEVTYLSINYNAPIHARSLFSKCKKRTKLIVFEGIKNIIDVNNILSIISFKIFVEKQLQDPFLIYPKFILVCKKNIQYDKFFEFNKSNIYRRFLVIII